MQATGLRSSRSPRPHSAAVRTSSSAFDFDDKDDSPPPSVKRSKMSPPSSSSSKFAVPKERRPVYQHKWTENDEDEIENTSEADLEERAALPAVGPASATQRLPIYKSNEGARVHKVKEAHQCLESGEHDDFKQDIEYILSTMKGDSSANIKCLSAISLARKCVSPEFRQFIRSEGLVSNVFKGLAEAASDQVSDDSF
ncbi:unnamed protein product [Cylicostephanus goldi]|uniref:WAPL domain-containing protein n=1 Tax=Cylicostephanus goldi TaxID=71465 RepID=A0A3P6RMY6_CYLGO|nr:unnamed protein product [Cylicostephanus goldi]